MLPHLFWRSLYRLALLLARPWVQVRLWRRQRSEPAYGERVAERFGHLPRSLSVSPVWFHTVSAGETIAAAPLIAELASEFPATPFLVTTMTPTGSEQVMSRLGSRVEHCYAPYDFPGAVRRFFDRIKPTVLVLMETELWPNMLREARLRGVPTLLVNGRLSARSARGYARIGPLTREMLGALKVIACQYPDHADRFRALGAASGQLRVLGSVKFDVALPADHGQRVAALAARWQLGDRPVWIAASTHPGEEQIVLEAHARVCVRHPDALLILAPRHPSRREEVAALLDAAGLPFVCMSDSLAPPSAHDTNVAGGRAAVILGDTMGELLYLYGLSRVAFIGGSLVPVGGHNPIEAAVCGQPLVMGAQTHNFTDVVEAFSRAGCLTLVTDAEGLARAVGDYLGDPARCARDGQRALRVVDDNGGASARLVTLLRGEISAAAAAG